MGNIKEPYHVRSSHATRSCTCRSIERSGGAFVSCIARAKAMHQYLLVEDPVVLVDVRDVAFVLVSTLPGELALLVGTE